MEIKTITKLDVANAVAEAVGGVLVVKTPEGIGFVGPRGGRLKATKLAEIQEGLNFINRELWPVYGQDDGTMRISFETN